MPKYSLASILETLKSPKKLVMQPTDREEEYGSESLVRFFSLNADLTDFQKELGKNETKLDQQHNTVKKLGVAKAVSLGPKSGDVKQNKQSDSLIQGLTSPLVMHPLVETKEASFTLMAPQDLATFITQHKTNKTTIPFSLMKKIMAEIILGLELLHNAKIAHRDLSSKNIVIFQNGESKEDVTAKIIDFGSAVKLEENGRLKTGTKITELTSKYVDPEIKSARGDYTNSDFKAGDIFSWGEILLDLASITKFHSSESLNEWALYFDLLSDTRERAAKRLSISQIKKHNFFGVKTLANFLLDASLTSEQVNQLIKELVGLVKALHVRGLAHHNLTAQNILIQREEKMGYQLYIDESTQVTTVTEEGIELTLTSEGISPSASKENLKQNNMAALTNIIPTILAKCNNKDEKEIKTEERVKIICEEIDSYDQAQKDQLAKDYHARSNEYYFNKLKNNIRYPEIGGYVVTKAPKHDDHFNLLPTQIKNLVDQLERLQNKLGHLEFFGAEFHVLAATNIELKKCQEILNTITKDFSLSKIYKQEINQLTGFFSDIQKKLDNIAAKLTMNNVTKTLAAMTGDAKEKSAEIKKEVSKGLRLNKNATQEEKDARDAILSRLRQNQP